MPLTANIQNIEGIPVIPMESSVNETMYKYTENMRMHVIFGCMFEYSWFAVRTSWVRTSSWSAGWVGRSGVCVRVNVNMGLPVFVSYAFWRCGTVSTRQHSQGDFNSFSPTSSEGGVQSARLYPALSGSHVTCRTLSISFLSCFFNYTFKHFWLTVSSKMYMHARSASFFPSRRQGAGCSQEAAERVG